MHHKYISTILLVVSCNALSSICYKVKEIGESCNWHDQCSSNLCFNKKCAPLPEVGNECAVDYKCGEGLGCNLDGFCAPIAGINKRCQMGSDGPFLCGNGLLCYDGICERPKSLYERCSDDEKCGPNYRCDSAKNENRLVCKTKIAAFELCKKTEDCSGNLYCDRKTETCKPLKKQHKFCITDDYCEENFYCLMNRNIFTRPFKKRKCQSLPKEGENCRGICATGFYCDYKHKSF